MNAPVPHFGRIAMLAALVAAAGCSGPDEPPAAPPPSTPPAASGAGAAAPDLLVDEKARTVCVPATVVEQGQYLELKGAIEYVLVAKGGKRYETLFETERSAADIHEALARIGLGRGVPATADDLPRGQRVNLLVEYPSGGRTVRRRVGDFLLDQTTGRSVPPGPWIYTGSSEAVDPDTGRPMLAASLTQSIVGLHAADSSSLVQNPRPESRQENVYRANVQALPPPGTAVRLVFERAVASVPAGVRRVHVFVSGRVQGVGFRAFTQHSAATLGLAGFVRNLDDGRVEAVVEGPAEKVGELLKLIERGPRAARVDKLDTADEPAEGAFETFEVWY
jgi:acylphosphatase